MPVASDVETRIQNWKAQVANNPEPVAPRTYRWIPEVSKNISYFAAVLNLLIPGVGTIMAGLKDKDGKNRDAILVGLLCLFFCGSFGWVFSLFISYHMVKNARKNDYH